MISAAARLPLKLKELKIELSTLIDHCPLSKNFLHLGCGDGSLCQAISSFVQFEQVIGLDYNPKKIALCLARKEYYKKSMAVSHFYFHHFGFPFRELPLQTLALISSPSLDPLLQHQVCHWIEESCGVLYIIAPNTLPLNAKHWMVKSREVLDEVSYYIYQRMS